MLCRRLTALQASTSSGPSGVRHLFVKPEIVVPQPYPESATRVHGIRSPKARAARLPNPKPPIPRVPHPRGLNPMETDRVQMVQSFTSVGVAGNRVYWPGRHTPGNTNPPTSAPYSEGSHYFELPRPVRPATDSLTGAPFTHSSPPLVRIDHKWLPKPARSKNLLLHGKREENDGKRVLHHRTTAQWNEDLAFAVRRRDGAAAIAFVQEMANNGVRCDETTLKLLVEVTDMQQLDAETLPEVVELRGRPETKLVIETEEAIEEDPHSVEETTASGVPQWKETLKLVANANRRIANLEKDIASLDGEDEKIAEQIRALRPLTPMIASTTKALMSAAEVRSREHAKTLFQSRTYKLEADLAAIRTDELGPVRENEDVSQRRTEEQIQDLEQQWRKYHEDLWYSDYEQGRQTEISIAHKIQQDVISPRKKSLSGFAAQSLKVLASKREALKSLKAAQKDANKAGEIVLPAKYTGKQSSSPIAGGEALVAEMDAVFEEVKQAIASETDLSSLPTPIATNTTLTPSERTLARQLIHSALTSTPIRTASTSSSSPIPSSSIDESSLLARATADLDASVSLVSHLETLESITSQRLTLPHWRSIIGRLAGFRASQRSSSTELIQEDWRLAFDTAYDLWLARSHTASQHLSPRPNRSLSAAAMEALDCATRVRPTLPVAVPVVLEVLGRILEVDGGRGLRASTARYSPHKFFEQPIDYQPLRSLAERNKPVYTLLQTATNTLRQATSLADVEVEEVERVRALMGQEGMFEFDPVWEEGMEVERIVEGRKMREMVGELRRELGGWTRKLGGEVQGEEEVRPEVRQEESETTGEWLMEGEPKTDGERVMSFAEGKEA